MSKKMVWASAALASMFLAEFAQAGGGLLPRVMYYPYYYPPYSYSTNGPYYSHVYPYYANYYYPHYAPYYPQYPTAYYGGGGGAEYYWATAQHGYLPTPQQGWPSAGDWGYKGGYSGDYGHSHIGSTYNGNVGYGVTSELPTSTQGAVIQSPTAPIQSSPNLQAMPGTIQQVPNTIQSPVPNSVPEGTISPISPPANTTPPPANLPPTTISPLPNSQPPLTPQAPPGGQSL